MPAFNVWLNNRLIDTVFQTMGKNETISEARESVRKSLIDHDGYDPDIRVTWPKGQRLTRDSFELEGNYGHGWELLCAEGTRKEARQRMREYMENAPCPLRIVKRRERVTS